MTRLWQASFPIRINSDFSKEEEWLSLSLSLYRHPDEAASFFTDCGIDQQQCTSTGVQKLHTCNYPSVLKQFHISMKLRPAGITWILECPFTYRKCTTLWKWSRFFLLGQLKFLWHEFEFFMWMFFRKKDINKTSMAVGLRKEMISESHLFPSSAFWSYFETWTHAGIAALIHQSDNSHSKCISWRWNWEVEEWMEKLGMPGAGKASSWVSLFK